MALFQARILPLLSWPSTDAPSLLIATLITPPVCPSRVSRFLPVIVSQTFTVLSKLPLTMRVPSLLIATLLTGPLCPLRVSRSLPVRASHTFTVLS